MQKNSKILLFFIVLVFSIVLPHSVHAILFNASNLLGHLNQGGEPNYFTGAANNGDPGPSSSSLYYPSQTVFDKVNHRIFIDDFFNNRVLVFQLDNNDTTQNTTASYVLGQNNFTSSTASTTRNGLNWPTGISYDSNNSRLFVAEYNNNRVLVFDVAPNNIANGMNASYVLGQADFNSKVALTTQGGMNGANSVEYDMVNDRLFVGETANHRVLVFDVAPNNIANGMNASYVLGQADFNSKVAALTQNGLKSGDIFGLAYDKINERLFITESASANRVMVFDVNPNTIVSGELATYVLGQPNFTTATANTTINGLSYPIGASYDYLNSRLFVADYSNNRVLVFDVAPNNIANGMNASYVLGQADFNSKVALTNQGGISNPIGLGYSENNNYLAIADSNNNRIIFYDLSNISNGMNPVNELGHFDINNNPLWANGNINNSATNGTVNALGFDRPASGTLDSKNHRLFISDWFNYRVLVFPLDDENNITTRIPSYVLGQADFTSNTYGTAANKFGTMGALNLNYDFDNDRLFVSDWSNHRVLIFNVAPGTITTGMNASYVLGQATFDTKTSGCTKNKLSGPDDIVYDRENSRLFVANQAGHRISVFNVAPGTIANNIDASYVLGQPNFTTCTSGLTQNKTGEITGVGYDPINSRLFANDLKNNRTLVFNVAPGTITTGMDASYVLGQNNFTSNTASTTRNGFNWPDDFHGYDPNTSRLFLSDSNNRRIMIFDVSPQNISNGMNAQNVLGQSDYTSADNLIDQSHIGYPNGTSVYDSVNNRLFISDKVNSRVMVFSMIKITTPSLPNGDINNIYSQLITTNNSQGTLSFHIYNGSLPNGLNLNSETGLISGFPTTSGISNFTIEARDNSDTGYFFDRANFSITTGDFSPPIITLVGSSIENIYLGYPYNDLGATVADNVDHDIIINTINNVDTSVLGTYIITYNAVDTAGNHATQVTRTVSVIKKLSHGFYVQPKKIPALISSLTPTYPSNKFTFSKNLKINTTDIEIKELQRYLNTHGFLVTKSGNGSPGHEIDYFGKATKEALGKFQIKNKIVFSKKSKGYGILGPKTREIINKSLVTNQ